MIRTIAKSCCRAAAIVFVTPLVVSFHVKALVIGRDPALHGSTQTLAMAPGLIGRYLRVAFLRCTLSSCDPSAAVEFGTLFSRVDARIGKNVYIGPCCHIGLACIGDDVLVASGVHIPSGAETHGTARVDISIREQAGQPKMVRIGAGSWIGSASVVMADVGQQSIVGAGAVVTRAIPEYSFAAGVPARVLHDRRAQAV
ncbi:MAG: acyltransferase [Luteitalea sp.]|nr:acyltransferase [Luteitalea sp.]